MAYLVKSNIRWKNYQLTVNDDETILEAAINADIRSSLCL